jgi:hypothetical protein
MEHTHLLKPSIIFICAEKMNFNLNSVSCVMCTGSARLITSKLGMSGVLPYALDVSVLQAQKQREQS